MNYVFKRLRYSLLSLFFLVISGKIEAQSALNYAPVRTTNASLVSDKNGNALSFPSPNIISNGTFNVNSLLAPIGFDFYFMGKRYTHFIANSGGVMALGLSNSSTFIFYAFETNDLTRPVSYPSVTNDAALIAPFWDQLGTAASGASVRTRVVGTAPNRCFAIEWRSRINRLSNTLDGIFQARLYETTGEIEYVYGSMAVGSSSSQVTASIGFTAGSADNSFLALKNFSTYDFTSVAIEEPPTQSLVNSNVAQPIFGLTSSTDGSRSRFSFAPPVATGNFSQLSFNNIGFNNITLNWTDNISNETQFVIYRSTDNISFTYDGSVAANATSYTAGNLTPNTVYYWKVIAVAEGNLGNFIAGQQASKLCSMQGLFKIGPGGDFATIQAAIDAAVDNGAGGHVVFELNQSYNPAAETIPINFKRVNCVGASSTITFRPEPGANGIVITSALNLATLYFADASWYRIDGRPGGTDTVFANLMTLENTNLSNSAVVLEHSSKYNVFTYLKIQGRNTQDTSGVFRIRGNIGTDGNDSVRVEYSHFTNSSGGFPKNLVYASGDPTGINDHLQLVHNNFSNHLISGTGNFRKTTAIYAGDNNNRLLVKGNSFYQTDPRNISADLSEYYEIYVENTNNGGNHIIDSNYIGGTGPLLSGPYCRFSSTLNYAGIHLKGKSGQPNSITNNKIDNIRYTFNLDQRSFIGISYAGPFNGNISNNIIGNPAIDSSIIVNSYIFGTNVDFFGIAGYVDMAQVVNDTIGINGNTISGIWGGSGSSGNVRLCGISAARGKYIAIRNNIIGSTTRNNSIANTTNDETAGIRYYDNFNTPAQPLGVLITGNNIAGLSTYATGLYNLLFGIRIGGQGTPTGSITVTGNTVQNMFSACNRDGLGYMYGVLAGISTENGLTRIEKNTVKNLQNLPQAAANMTICGIDLAIFNLTAAQSTMPVYGNYIHSLGGNTVDGVKIYGIRVRVANLRATANMIRLGTNSDGSTINSPHRFTGIGLIKGFTIEVLQNSVAINGSNVPNVTNAQSSYALYSAIERITTTKVQNNIFTNFRTHAATSPMYANYAVVSDSVLQSANQQFNYNIYHTEGTNTRIANYLSSAYDTLRFWKNATFVDANSISANPNFVSVDGDESTFNLHLNSPTPAERSGQTTGVLYDFDGENYSTLTPIDIGADAGNYTWIDRSAPNIIVNSPLDSTGESSDRILANVSITDQHTGVDNYTATTRPAIWFRKKKGPIASDWAHSFGTITSGTLYNGSWEFPIAYNLLNLPCEPGDTIQYYIVAQDTANPINIGYAPAIGTFHNNTEFQVSPPDQPYYYKLIERLPTLLTVGTGQPYTSFTGANGLFKAINLSGGLSGPTIVTVTSNLTETGAFPLNGYKMNGFPMEIKPASATVFDIRNITSTSNKTFDLNGVKKLTVNGSFNGTGRYLQFVNGNSSTNASVFNISNGCDSISLLNSVIAANAGDTTTQANIVLGSGNNTNIVIAGNQIMNSSSFVAYRTMTNTGLLSTSAGNKVKITNNEITDFSYFGINLRNCGNNILIDSNHFFLNDTVTALETSIRVIRIGTGGGHTITHNYLGGTRKFCGGGRFRYNVLSGGTYSSDGIRVIFVNTSSIERSFIRHNTISSFELPYSIYNGSFIGIDLYGTGEFEVTHNLVGHETTPNNIYSQLSSGINAGMQISNTGLTIVDSNIIANMNGYYPSAGIPTIAIRNVQGTHRQNRISNNKIHHLYSGAQGIGGISLCGIYSRNLATIYNNSIHHLEATNPAGNYVYVYALNISDPATTDTSAFGRIERNRIYQIRHAGSSSNLLRGIWIEDGKWDIINNQVLLTNTGYTTDVRTEGLSINENIAHGDKRIFYNTVVIGGNNGSNGAGLSSVAGYIYPTTKGQLRNNIFYNNRVGAGHHATLMANANPQAGNFRFDSSICNNNFFAHFDSTRTIRSTTNLTLQAWRNQTTSDRESYFVNTDTIPMLQFFVDTSVGNLDINNNFPYCWAVNGKGLPLATVNGDFLQDNVRSTSIATGGTDIGSDEFSTTTTPPAIRVSGNHVPGGADTLRQSGRIIGYITWENTGSLPVLGPTSYYSGQWPNDTTNGGTASNVRPMNAWWNIPATDGNGYGYSVTFFYDSSILGRILDPTTMILHKRDGITPGTWHSLPTMINVNNRTITAMGLTDFSEFAVTGSGPTMGRPGADICYGNSTSFKTLSTGAGYTYQWQVNSGTGFTDISNTSVYGGTNTPVLTLSNVPSVFNGYEYQCIINTGLATITSPSFKLRILNTWKGTVNSDWNEPSNWECGQVPDANTDVVIVTGVPNYPVINTTVTCKMLFVSKDATITFDPGARIDITGK